MAQYQAHAVSVNGHTVSVATNVEIRRISDANVEAKTFTANGVYNASDDALDGYNPVTVDVDIPDGSYGTPTWQHAISQGSRLLIHPTFPNFDDGYMASAPNISDTLTLEAKTVTPSDSQQVVTPTDLNHYLQRVTVNPITYSASDEGKVVSNGALTAQTSRTVTENGTYDTTLNDEVVVNVSGGGGDEPLIPAAYQRVEYIEGSGSGAVIDTGFIPTKYTSAILKFTPLVVTGDSLFGTMGVLSADKDKWRVFNYGSSFYFDIGTSRAQLSNGLPANTQRYASVGNKWIIDMTTGISLTATSAIEPSATFTTHIFINGGAQNKSANSRWYDVKIFDNGNLVRDFVPCYRIADDVVGLYDRVTEAFFINIGNGGSFVAGPDVVSANDLLIILLGGDTE